MPDIDKLKAQQEKVKTEIRQLENHQKILLNRKTDAERKARTRRLIEHGAVLESIFPAVTAMTGEEVKAVCAPCRGRGVLWTQWGATLPKPLVCSTGKDTRSASALSSEANLSQPKGGEQP